LFFLAKAAPIVVLGVAFAKGTPKGWNGYQAMDYSYRGVKLNVAGDVCADTKCRISIQAKYTKNG
jgi:hypothetical protein